VRVLKFGEAEPDRWLSPNITGVTRKWVPFAEGAEQVDISFIKFPVGIHSTYHVHSTDQLLIAIDGVGFIETVDGRQEFGAGDVVHCPAGERHRHGATESAPLDQVSIVVASRFAD
jgi:quercetin dioxygenase-like cupin family protein